MSFTTHAASNFDALLAPLANMGELPLLALSREAAVLHVINGEHFSGAERVQQLLTSFRAGRCFR